MADKKKGNAFTNNPLVRAIGLQKIVVVIVLIALIGVEMCFPSPWPAWVWWCLAPVVYMLARGVYLLIKRYFPRALVLMTGGK